MKTRTAFTTLFISIIFFFGCNPSQQKSGTGDLIIFHAGSLSVPVKQISGAFEAQHPGIDVLSEAAGSVACARKITDLHRSCDVMLSADYRVIDKFLIPKYASWNIKFAGNEMALVYSKHSKYAAQIDPVNWPGILLRPDVHYGRSNPNMDPCGYRTVITLELAEKFLNQPQLKNALLAKDTRYMRPKETDLLALLETGTLDYIFIYKSVAIQHQLPYVSLSDSINLSNPELDNWYATATVKILGRQPNDTILQHGEAMVYGLTIPKNAPHPELAMQFVSFFLNKNKGLKILGSNGQQPLTPAPSATYGQIPEALRKFASPENR